MTMVVNCAAYRDGRRVADIDLEHDAASGLDLAPPGAGAVGERFVWLGLHEPSEELLRRVHGNSRHVGRRYEPPNATEMERAGTVAELRERLRRAIDGEQFELAATLRDQLKVLE